MKTPFALVVIAALCFAAAPADPAARSQALFLRASRVMFHPRCSNCHPAGDSPLQGMNQKPHDPPVTRGPAGMGVVGMQCQSCHQDENQALSRVPGAPGWHLAPTEMAWVGKTPRQLCEQLKDPKRNGGRDLGAIIDHSAHAPLLAWAWAPGADREKAPGTQAEFAALIEAWVKTGAVCPEEGAKP